MLSTVVGYNAEFTKTEIVWTATSVTTVKSGSTEIVVAESDTNYGGVTSAATKAQTSA